jgi:hypothetical protein
VYDSWSGQKDAASYPTYNGRGGTAKSPDYRTGDPVWQVWLSQDYSITQSKSKGTSGESQKGGKDLEEGRVEGAKEATETKKAVA